MDPEGLAWSGVTGAAKEPLKRDWGNSRLSEDLQAWVLSGVWRARRSRLGIRQEDCTGDRSQSAPQALASLGTAQSLSVGDLAACCCLGTIPLRHVKNERALWWYWFAGPQGDGGCAKDALLG